MKHILCLILAMSLFILCGCTGNPPDTIPTTEPPTIPTQTTVPETSVPPETTAPPETTEPVLEHPMHEAFLATGFEYSQGETHDIKHATDGGELVVKTHYEDVLYLYTGDSPEIELASIGATLTLPESWLDRVYVIQHTSGLDCDTGCVYIVSRAVMQAHKDMVHESTPGWTPRWNIDPPYVINDCIFKIWNDRKPEPEGYSGRNYPTYFDENDHSLFFLITSDEIMTLSSDVPVHRFLIDYYGQEYCDQLVGDLVVDRETAISMVRIP